MGARYQQMEVGVLDLATGKKIMPDMSDQEWLAYLAALNAGDVPLPAAIAEIVKPTPAEEAARINTAAQQKVLAAYPLWVQANCANGIYPVSYADKMRSDIAAVIIEANRCTDLVLAGQPATPNWPGIGV